MANPRGWVHANETALQMHGRINEERPALFLPPLNRVPIRAGDVIEITGPSPTAKSEILLEAAIHCILPKEWNGVHFGGLERVVAYIDLDCRFDVFRLSQVLKLRIMSAYGPSHCIHRDLCEVSSRSSFLVSQADHLDDELFLSCMKRFLYIRCYNSSEFLAALQTVRPGSISSSEGLGVSLYILIIDSIGAFHWNDRACQTLTKDGSTREKLSLEKLTETVVQEINKIREVQPLLVLASKATIFGAATPTNDADRQRGGGYRLVCFVELYSFGCIVLEDYTDFLGYVGGVEYLALEVVNKALSKGSLTRGKVFHRGHSEVSKIMNKQDRKTFLYREYMPPVWQLFVTQKVFLGTSDAVSSDGRIGESPTYVCEWIKPRLNILDKFTVRNNGICMVS